MKIIERIQYVAYLLDFLILFKYAQDYIYDRNLYLNKSKETL